MLWPMNVEWNIYYFIQAYALNIPPGDYDRKIKTQRNWRKFAQAVEHVV